jgi:hypothetical protein
MPWTSAEAVMHTKKASSPKKKQVWSEVANKQLDKSGDDASAVRVANYVVKGMGKGKKKLLSSKKSCGSKSCSKR